MTITASRRRPPRLDNAVSLTVEPMKTLLKEYGSYKGEVLRDAHDVQGEQERRLALYRNLISTSQVA